MVTDCDRYIHNIRIFEQGEQMKVKRAEHNNQTIKLAEKANT